MTFRRKGLIDGSVHRPLDHVTLFLASKVGADAHNTAKRATVKLMGIRDREMMERSGGSLRRLAWRGNCEDQPDVPTGPEARGMRDRWLN